MRLHLLSPRHFVEFGRGGEFRPPPPLADFRQNRNTDPLMAAIFNKLGIRFLYPENWTLDESEALEGNQVVTVFSPGGSFWSVMIDPPGTAPEKLAATALKAMRQQYDELDAEEVQETRVRHGTLRLRHELLLSRPDQYGPGPQLSDAGGRVRDLLPGRGSRVCRDRRDLPRNHGQLAPLAMLVSRAIPSRYPLQADDCRATPTERRFERNSCKSYNNESPHSGHESSHRKRQTPAENARSGGRTKAKEESKSLWHANCFNRYPVGDPISPEASRSLRADFRRQQIVGP